MIVKDTPRNKAILSGNTSGLTPLTREEAVLMGQLSTYQSESERDISECSGGGEVEFRTVTVCFASTSDNGALLVPGYISGDSPFAMTVTKIAQDVVLDMPYTVTVDVPIVNGNCHMGIFIYPEYNSEFDSVSGYGFSNSYYMQDKYIIGLSVTSNDAVVRVKLKTGGK